MATAGVKGVEERKDSGQEDGSVVSELKPVVFGKKRKGGDKRMRKRYVDEEGIGVGESTGVHEKAVEAADEKKDEKDAADEKKGEKDAADEKKGEKDAADEKKGEKDAADEKKGEKDAPRDANAEVVNMRREVELLREAQRLREDLRRRQPHQQQRIPGMRVIGVDDDDEPLVAGLRTNFAAEREDQDLEQQCEKYIAEGMKIRGYGRGIEMEEADTNDNAQDELYRVPENLRVEERPAYDPGEGLPAAGLEEVEIDDMTKKQNAADTLRAVRHMGKGRARATDHLVAERFKKRFKR